MKKIHTISLLLILTLTISAQSYEDMVTKAMDLIEQDHFVAAEQAIKAALRKEPANPNNAMLMVNLGTIQRNLGKLEEALISYDVAMEKYPDNAFIRHNRAALYCEMDDFANALKDYNTILLTDPKDTEALYRRGLIYLSEKNLLSAEDDFEKILNIAPENLKGKMGVAAIKKRRSEWKEAEELYSDLIYKYKENADLYFNRAECYMELNKLGRAQEDLNKAQSLGYDGSPLYILRGKIKLSQYEKRGAKEDFLRAKELGADAVVVNELLILCK